MNTIDSTYRPLRFSGIASGLDTETMIKDIMRVEQMKVDKLKQDRQTIEWQRDEYRNITNLLRGLKDDFFNLVKPDNNMLSANSYKSFNVTSTNEEYIAATANASAMQDDYTISSIDSLASSAKLESSAKLCEEGITLNLNTQLKDVVLSGGNKIEFAAGKVKFTINNESFEFSQADTLRKVINTVNDNSKAGVTLSYSSITDKFTMKTNSTGKDAKLNIEENSGNLLSALDFLVSSEKSKSVEGTDAQLTINGTKIIRNTNTFTIDGITFDIRNTFADQTVTLKLREDIEPSFNKIKAFVDKYNDVLDKINSKLIEKKSFDYPPLTDEQKENMKDKDIELWEEKSKNGLLRNDPILQNIVYGLRKALITKVEGVDLSLSEIGITTGPWYENGKLHINESKLKEALSNKGNQVMNLFTQQYEKSYSPDLSQSERQSRFENAGIMWRISDILDDNIRTSRDKDNNKGALLEKAGIKGDTTEFKNILDSRIKYMDDRIDSMIETLFRKEEYYWRQFTAMEKAIEQMNSQSMWLAQQLGMGK